MFYIVEAIVEVIHIRAPHLKVKITKEIKRNLGYVIFTGIE